LRAAIVSRAAPPLVAILVAHGMVACASAGSVQDTAAIAASPQAGNETGNSMSLQSMIPGYRQPRPGLLTGGQPDAAAWPLAATAGVTTVITLRAGGELGGRDEAAEVAAAGLDYMQLPVDGAADITVGNAARLWGMIEAARGTVLVHCGSGNRVGALLALAAASEGGMSPVEALAYGRSAGLTSAEPRVRELLGLPAAD
jgi:uncharacterized protein (TIGR01244 family)